MIQEEQKKISNSLKQEEAEIISGLAIFAQKDPGIEGGFNVPFPNEGAGLHENALEIEEFERRNALKNNMKKRLRDVRATICKIENGLYGQCENCLGKIESNRLQVAPVARLCVGCAKQNPRGA